MRKLLNIILLTAGFVLLWGCDEYDDGELRKNIDAIEQELTAAEKRVAELNDEMNSLTALVNSSFISYLKQDDKGNYVVCYRNHGGETKTRHPRHAERRGDRPDRRGPGSSPTENSTGARPRTTARPMNGYWTPRAR